MVVGKWVRRRWVMLSLSGLLFLGAVVCAIWCCWPLGDLPGKTITPVPPSVYEPWLALARQEFEVSKERPGTSKRLEYYVLCRAGQFEKADALYPDRSIEQNALLLSSLGVIRWDLGDYAGGLEVLERIEVLEERDGTLRSFILIGMRKMRDLPENLPDNMPEHMRRLAWRIEGPVRREFDLMALARFAAERGDIGYASELLGQCGQCDHEDLSARIKKLQRALDCCLVLRNQAKFDPAVLGDIKEDDVSCSRVCEWLGSAGRYDRAVEVTGQVMTARDRASTLARLASQAFKRGDAEQGRRLIGLAVEAAREFERLKIAGASDISRHHRAKDSLRWIARVMAVNGMKDEALVIVDELRKSPEMYSANENGVIDVYFACDMMDEALAYEKLNPEIFVTERTIKHLVRRGDIDAAVKVIERCKLPGTRARFYLHIGLSQIDRYRDPSAVEAKPLNLMLP